MKKADKLVSLVSELKVELKDVPEVLATTIYQLTVRTDLTFKDFEAAIEKVKRNLVEGI